MRSHRSPRRSRRAALISALISALFFVSTAGHALTPEEEATSIRLMKDGIAARDRGDLEAAERSFRAAHQLADLPSSGYALASVLARRGRLVEALIVAQGVRRMTPSPSWSSAAADGYRQAGPLADELERRVASVTIRVEGAEEASLRVTLDGVALKPPVIGVARQVDPGRHELAIAGDGFVTETSSLDLREGEQRRVDVTLKRASSSGVAPAPGADGAVGEEEELEVRALLVAGIVTAGVGLGAIGAGLGLGVASQSKEDDIADQCPGGECPERLFPELDEAENLALGANVLLIAGGVLAAAGTTLIVIDLASGDGEADEDGAATRLHIGPASVSLSRHF